LVIVDKNLIINAHMFDFKLSLIGGGNNVQINSKYDVWYVPNIDYIKEVNNIPLKHFNTHGSGGAHSQGKYRNMNELIRDIDSHDKRLIKEAI